MDTAYETIVAKTHHPTYKPHHSTIIAPKNDVNLAPSASKHTLNLHSHRKTHPMHHTKPDGGRQKLTTHFHLFFSFHYQPTAINSHFYNPSRSICQRQVKSAHTSLQHTNASIPTHKERRIYPSSSSNIYRCFCSFSRLRD